VHAFSQKKNERLPPHSQIDHAIDLDPHYKLQYRRICNLSQFKLKILKAYIETNLANFFNQQSSCSAAALILLPKNKDRRLQLCVDYRALNIGTVKNKYLLALMSELLD
jgi:hypothetical protein